VVFSHEFHRLPQLGAASLILLKNPCESVKSVAKFWGIPVKNGSPAFLLGRIWRLDSPAPAPGAGVAIQPSITAIPNERVKRWSI
jgi:hypothetical protein